MSLRFRAHDTFYIRRGWLNKGLKHVDANPEVFLGSDGNNPMDVLGIGSNMVKALRYWMQAVSLTFEPSKGKKIQKLTDLGHLVFNHDKYLEESGTLWLLHYKLASNKEIATSWYYFFNEFKPNEFSRDDFVSGIKSFILAESTEEVSERSLDDDFSCLINTYVPKVKMHPEKIHPENNMECPLSELGLIDIVNKKQKVYRKAIPQVELIHPLIFLSIIIDQASGRKEIKISSLLNDRNNVGRIFNLDPISLSILLQKLELADHLKINRTAGLDVILLKSEMTFLDCINEYYKTLNFSRN